MATYTKPVLSLESFDELIRRLKDDGNERRKAIGLLQTRGLLPFWEEYFALIDGQRGQFEEVASDPAAAFQWQALLSQGLTQGVPIVITPPPIAVDASVHIEVTVDSNGKVHVEVHIKI